MRKPAYEKLVKADLPTGDTFLPGDTLGQGDPGFASLIKNLNAEHDFMERKQRKKYLREFVHFTNSLDQIRNTSIKNIVPNLQPLFEEADDMETNETWSVAFEKKFRR